MKITKARETLIQSFADINIENIKGKKVAQGMSYYRNSVRAFREDNCDKIFTSLSLNLTEKFDANNETMKSWIAQVSVLQSELTKIVAKNSSADNWRIILEYEIPVLGKRIDAVLLANKIVFVVEYKDGDSCTGTSALLQAQDYALKLHDFHSESRNKVIIPLALGNFHHVDVCLDSDPGLGGICATNRFADTVNQCFEKWSDASLNPALEKWDTHAIFHPIPSVFDATCLSLSEQNVAELKHAKASAKNLTITQNIIISEINDAKKRGVKKLIVLTGVPGAGKTLAGINAVVAAKKILEKDQEQTVFLSGNLPLIRVLTESLRRDAIRRGKPASQNEAMINNMHRFTESSHKSGKAPAAKFVVFDEAQRAWDKKKNAKNGFDIDEASMILKSMALHKDWAVLLALVGNGQEIHSGEAGLCSWGDAVLQNPGWEVVTSPIALNGFPGEPEDPHSNKGNLLFRGMQAGATKLTQHADLHLGDPQRSYEFELSSQWVELVLKGDKTGAALLLKETPTSPAQELPIFISRDLEKCRKWLTNEFIAKNRRAGIIASSGAIRLRSDGVEPPSKDFIKSFDKYERWFLDSHRDEYEGGELIKAGSHYSSNKLEVAMSEFEMQGLEIDVSCLLWGGDLIIENGKWIPRTFSDAHSKWKLIKESKKGEEGGNNLRKRKISKYRVLMTRYRYRMIIYMPQGKPNDSSINSAEFDSTYDFLVGAGARPI